MVNQELMKKGAYDILSSEYIEKKSITIDNVYEYVPKVDKELLYIPIDMKLKGADNVKKFMIYGYAIDQEYNAIGYLYVIVNMDVKNQAFSIEPIDKEEYENGKIQNNNIRIEANDNNQYS